MDQKLVCYIRGERGDGGQCGQSGGDEATNGQDSAGDLHYKAEDWEQEEEYDESGVPVVSRGTLEVESTRNSEYGCPETVLDQLD